MSALLGASGSTVWAYRGAPESTASRTGAKAMPINARHFCGQEPRRVNIQAKRHSSYNSMILLSFGVQIRRNRANYEVEPRAILPFFERRIRLIPQKTKARKLRTIIKSSIPGARQRLQDRPRSGEKNRPFEELNEWVTVEISPLHSKCGAGGFESNRLLPPIDQQWLYFSLPRSEDCLLTRRKFRTDMLSG